MFCGNCGKPVKEYDVFCTCCGKKNEHDEPVKQTYAGATDNDHVMYSVSIGYIIELNEEKGLAQIETGRGNVFMEKSDYEFRRQVDFCSRNASKEKIEKWRELQGKGVFFFAETIEDLFNKIKGLFPVRQGMKYKKGDRLFIFCGEGPKEVAEIQSYVWQNAEGKHTLDEIFSKVNATKMLNTSDPVRDFVESVVGLVRLGAMFLKF